MRTNDERDDSLCYKLTENHVGEYLVEYLKTRGLIGENIVYAGIDLYAEGGRITLLLKERREPNLHTKGQNNECI